MFQVSGAACVQGRRQSAWAWCLRGTVSGLIGAARGGGTALSCAPRVSGQEAGAWSYESLLGAMEGSLARCTPGSGFTQQPALCQDLRKTWQAWQASWASLGVRLRTHGFPAGTHGNLGVGVLHLRGPGLQGWALRAHTSLAHYTYFWPWGIQDLVAWGPSRDSVPPNGPD